VKPDQPECEYLAPRPYGPKESAVAGKALPQDRESMTLALAQARRSFEDGGIPVGARPDPFDRPESPTTE